MTNPSANRDSDVSAPDNILGQVRAERDYFRSIAEHTGSQRLGTIHELTRIVKTLRKTEQALLRSQEELESRVAERTADLIKLNAELLIEVAERKQAEELLRVSRSKYQTLLENTSDWVWEIDKDGRYTYVSPQIRGLLGYDPEEVIGKTPFDLMPDEERALITDVFHSIVNQRRPFMSLENRNLHKDGRIVILETNGVPFFDEDGAFSGYRGIDRDVTERKRAEEDRQKIQRLESLGILAGGIAHDFNNILTAILGNISLAKTKIESGSPLSGLLEEAEKASFHARDLTQQLLPFAKGGKPIKSTVSADALIRDSMSFTVTDAGVNHRFTCAGDLRPIEVDEGQMLQVLNNILINACQAMTGGGEITIAAENTEIGKEDNLPIPEGEYVKISIRDQGDGIPPEHIGKIFDPYFTTKQKGSGLGLAIAHSIVKNHDGLIRVESEPGVGSIFIIYLPASSTKSPWQISDDDESVTGEGRVLLMDDEDIVRSAVGEILLELGYSVEYAADGEEAIMLYRKARASARPFDAIIMDLTVSVGMGGKEAIEKLLEIDPQVKAIVSSGYSHDPIMSNYIEYGFCEVMAKPFNVIELAKKLRKVIKLK